MRLLGTFSLVLVTGAAFAQAPFTIVRPVDGSKVRETVKILIPKNSVPPGGYIGIFIGGKFVEATTPALDKTKKFYEYDLDTKGRKIEDGKVSLEAVLYADYENQPRIVNRSSVEVTVQNSAESNIPESGIYLRYKWAPGTQAIYDYSIRSIIDTGDSKANAEGEHANEVASDPYSVRVLYSTETRYGNGDGLVRSQLVPEKGKDYGIFLVNGSPDPVKLYDVDMHSVYQRLTPTGLEVFGSIPISFPFEGTAGESYTSLLSVHPLPTLPTKKVRPGSSWSARFQRGAIDLNNMATINTLVSHYIARGEFKDVEWEMGHPCARIENSIESAQESVESKKLKEKNADFTGDKVAVKETVWFALDKQVVLKVIRTSTVETEIANQNSFGGPNGGPPGFGPGGPQGPGAGGGGKKIPNRPGVSGGGGGGKIQIPSGQTPSGDFQAGGVPGPRGRGRQLPGVPGGLGGPSGPPGFGPGGRGGVGTRGRGGNGVAPAGSTFIKLTREETFVLEQ